MASSTITIKIADLDEVKDALEKAALVAEENASLRKTAEMVGRMESSLNDLCELFREARRQNISSVDWCDAYPFTLIAESVLADIQKAKDTKC